MTRSLAALVGLGLVLSTPALQGQDRAPYRDIQHQPVVMQKLGWRPPYFTSGSSASQTDPVRQIVFSFSDDQLSRMVADADHGSLSAPAVWETGTVLSPIEDRVSLPWGLRRAGAGVRLTVAGLDLTVRRNGLNLSKSIKF
jgi:hypothetical protein